MITFHSHGSWMYLRPVASIYIHIPFCKQACHYCDFHFSTSTQRMDEMVQALRKELKARSEYLSGQSISSVYFGGGTPSLLSDTQLKLILDQIQELFVIDGDAEITLEANPDDLDRQKIDSLIASGVNRLSIGIQSFVEAQLRRMNRAHTSKEAEFAVKCAQDRGLENITADLIFALPDLTVEAYTADLRRLLGMGVKHLSAYGLTMEPRTVFHKWSATGRIQEANAATFEAHFRITPQVCMEYGLEHYEVSNFGMPHFYSRHNTAYWKGAHYVGIGPSAHSYNGTSRQWNIANNPQYLHKVETNEVHWEKEVIDAKAACNEYLMTGLRTKWGIDLDYLQQQTEWTFGDQQIALIHDFAQKGLATLSDRKMVLTMDGLLQVDSVTAALFV
jgi:oxygen-independent coproporphyrinogen III oxidase